MTETTIYSWINQEKIDRGEIVGQTTDQALELAAVKHGIRELETELAVSWKVNEIFLDQDLAQSLFPVIESLTGQGINVRHACRVLGVSESGSTTGRTGRRQRRHSGAYGLPARSRTCTGPLAASTALNA